MSSLPTTGSRWAPRRLGHRTDRRGARPGPRRIPVARLGRLPGPPPRHARCRPRRVRQQRAARRHRTPARHLPVVAELGRWCFETATPLAEGTYDAARGAVDIALTATTGARRRGPRVRPVPAARPPRAAAAYGGYCFFNNAAIAAQSRRRRTRSGHGARRRLPPRQRHAADLLRPRRRAVRVAARRPGRAYPCFTGFADETGAGRGTGCDPEPAVAAGTDDDAYLARGRALRGAHRRVRARRSSSSRSAWTPTATIRSPTSR